MRIVKSYWAEVVNAPVVFITGLWSLVKMSQDATGVAFGIPFVLFLVSGLISLIMMLWRLVNEDMSIDQNKN